MPALLLEIGCEELPAAACREARRQLPELVRGQLAVDPSRLYVSPRRLAVLVDDLPALREKVWVKGPPLEAPDQARDGFARRHGVAVEELKPRVGFWGVEKDPPPLSEQLGAIVRGLTFSRPMLWRAGGLRFPRPIRWLLAKLDSETVEFEVGGLVSGSVTFGHRFTHGEIEVPDAGAYAGLLRNAAVEPDDGERERLIRAGLDAIGGWIDPLGKLAEVVYMVESVAVLEAEFDERFLQLPRRVVVTAMQSHQRYFPLERNGFAFVANGGDPEVVRAGNRQVLENRLDDADFTFRRDRERGIEELAKHLGSITFFKGAGSFADKTERLVDLVRRLGGGEASVEAARLAKADQASELVREYPDLEGHIGAEYARLAGYPEAVCLAIDEQYLPDGQDAPLPQTEPGKVLSAADKIDTLVVSFGLGHKPTGSRDPYGLRRAAIGLCRLADEGGLTVPRELLPDGVREFVEERLESLLDVPVEFVRAAKASAMADLGGVAWLARQLGGLPGDRLGPIQEVYTRAARISRDAEGEVDPALLAEPAELALAQALQATDLSVVAARNPDAFATAAELAPTVQRFFDEVLVMAEDSAIRANRLALLAQVRDEVGRLGDFSQIPR